MREKVWVPIPGYIGTHAASNDGEIISMNYMRTGLPAILKIEVNWAGYCRVWVNGFKRKSVHELVALAFIGPRPQNAQINHIDGNKSNNSPDNLEYCTASENIRHAHSTGLAKPVKGSQAPWSKLDEEKIVRIRELCRGGMQQKDVAVLFGVCKQSVSDIMRKKTWSHVKDETIT